MLFARLVVGKANTFLKQRLLRESVRTAIYALCVLGDYMNIKVDIFWKLTIRMYVMPNVKN
tara:strand:- start:2003 stop:2185 length:183 start_codon:yes stop_codon:yes gene_type:complete